MARRCCSTPARSRSSRCPLSGTRGLVRDVFRKKFPSRRLGHEKASPRCSGRPRAGAPVLLVQVTRHARDEHPLARATTHRLHSGSASRWSATPPALLAHLLKPTSRRNVGLAKLILKHPNVPSRGEAQLRSLSRADRASSPVKAHQGLRFAEADSAASAHDRHGGGLAFRCVPQAPAGGPGAQPVGGVVEISKAVAVPSSQQSR